ncbi:hypothetical protein [Longispora fulva]|uniref:hypothetical protein n=1 Tax=Longispora fulva TaxID=619741 RepID=UPI0036DD8728
MTFFPAGPPSGPIVHGCHGGAGASTLARLLELPDLPTGWAPPPQARLLLVARGTPYGSRAAVSVLAALRAQPSLAALALVVVGDGPWPEPMTATRRLVTLGPLVPAVVRVPFVGRWRYLDDPLSARIPRAVTSALARIRAALAAPEGGIPS